MVSPLWDACSDGRLDDVHKLLTDASLHDIEVKDASGITPLIRAIQQGHVEVVRALLDNGADPLNPSHHGPPQQYTTDPAILDLLRSKIPEEKNFAPDIKSFYSPAAPYAYYPPPAGTATPEGAVYYPPPSTGENGSSGGPGHLPPPDIARLIPCRYFPACRYGTSCMFAHPQGPYFQGSLPPPAQYPTPYDPMNPQSYPPNYYPPSFQHQNPSPPAPPMAPPSDSVSPPPHFSPSAPYPTMMSPSMYAHPGQVPVMSLPPLQQQPPGTQAPVVYPAPVPPVSPYSLPQADTSNYPPVALPSPYTQVNGLASASPDSPVIRDASGRRGTGRRLSTYSRKPPCLFFPAGKCKNGDDCRFPHVPPDSIQQPRGNAPRTRVNGNPNGLNGIDEKLAGLSFQGQNGQGSSRFQSSEPGNRTRYAQGKNSQTNGLHQKKPPAVKQRVPNADEFPVLAGSTTPPSGRLALNASGPTAAQVLQAPAPFKRENGAHTPEDLNTNGVQNGLASNKLPLSFAAAATGPAVSDTTKEVPVSA